MLEGAFSGLQEAAASLVVAAGVLHPLARMLVVAGFSVVVRSSSSSSSSSSRQIRSVEGSEAWVPEVGGWAADYLGV